MIISASYKTDIPAFYGKWFVNRLRAGYCKMVNPYNHRVHRVRLDPEYVDGFVFWTKNAGPFLRHLRTVRAHGRPFIVQYTINGYPRALESHVLSARKNVEHARRIAGEYGPSVVVWRYDTILLSSLTPPEFHFANFAKLSRALAGTVDEVVISFMHLYAKTERNLAAAAAANGIEWWDPSLEEKRALTRRLVHIAEEHGIRLSVCAQPANLVPGASEARCVDADRLEAIGGASIQARLRGNRAKCGCFESRDIGEYNTCPQGCVYCYAVADTALARARFKQHDPASEFLFAPPRGAVEVPTKKEPVQLPLL